KWNEPMPMEYAPNWTGELESGMAQYERDVADATARYSYNATKRDFIMALLDLARTGDNKYYDKMLNILSKNPNFWISINGEWVAGRDAANALSGTMAKLPGDLLGINQSPGQRNLSDAEATKQVSASVKAMLKDKHCRSFLDAMISDLGSYTHVAPRARTFNGVFKQLAKSPGFYDSSGSRDY